MARILITGGAGFIGSNLASKLARDGHEITILDNMSPQIHGSNPMDSPQCRNAAAAGRIIVGDVTSRDDLVPALEGQEILVHLAAETGTGQSMYQIERYNQVNVGGTATLLDLLANDPDRTVRKIVVASSRSIYGEGAYLSAELGVVYPEARLESDLLAGRFEPRYPGATTPLKVVPTTESAKIHPSSVYGITKSTQEQLIMTVAPTLGIAAVGLRYQNVYGPGQSLSNPYTGILSIFSSLIRQGKPINIFEDGLESRDFVYIDDVVAVTAQAALDARADNRIFNVGSGVGTTVQTVVDELMDAYGMRVPTRVSGNFRLGDIRHNIADLTAVQTALEFRPNVDFREGVRRFAQWVSTQEVSSDGYEASLSEMREKNLLK